MAQGPNGGSSQPNENSSMLAIERVPSNPPTASNANMATSTMPPQAASLAEDSDPDFDDLDDVLDQFSAATAPKENFTNIQSQPTQQFSGLPPSKSPTNDRTTPAGAEGPQARLGESEENFLMRLTAEVISAMDNAPQEQDATASADETANIQEELKDFTAAMEKQGISPEDVVGALLGNEGISSSEGQDEQKPQSGRAGNGNLAAVAKTHTSDLLSYQAPKEAPGGGIAATSTSSFEDSIRRAMERMRASDSNANTAVQSDNAKPNIGPGPNSFSSPSRDDVDLEGELLKAMDALTSQGLKTPSAPTEKGQPSASGSDDEAFNTFFATMMNQLTTKDVLYEPMKELDSKFPAWLAQYQGGASGNNNSSSNVSNGPQPSSNSDPQIKQPPPASSSDNNGKDDSARYRSQAAVVKEIVSIFEAPSYGDGDPRSRQLIWDKMQIMQSLGNPPEDLVGNPLGGLMGLGMGLGEGGSAGAERTEDDLAGIDPAACPTQ